MRWYFPLFTLTFALAAWAHIRFEWIPNCIWLVPVYAVFCLTACLLARRFRKAVFAVCLLAGCGAGFAYVHLYTGLVHQPLDALDSKSAVLSATVTDYADRYEDSQRVALKIDTRDSGLDVWMPSFATLAYVPLTEEELTPGDRVEGRFTFYRGSTNGGFDRAAYYAGQNYHILASCETKITVTKPETVPLLLRPQIWAREFREKLDGMLSPRSAAFLKALLFGDRSGLSTHDRQSFQKSGLSHVMAVSGMHIGFLIAFFVVIFGRRFGLLLAMAAIIVFVPMAGASPSVIRAAVMYAFAAVGFFLRLENSALHAMCAALVLLLLYNPYAVGSLSLQLSFLATLGLIAFSGKIQRVLLSPFWEKLKGKSRKKTALAVAGTFSCTVSTLLLTMPVLFSSFGYVSAASVLANLLTIGVFALLFICGFLLCFAGGVPGVSALLTGAAEGLCSYVFGVTDRVGQMTALLLYWDSWYVKTAVGILYLIFAAKLLAKKRFPAPYVALACCAVLLPTLYCNARAAEHHHEITVFSCGSGQAIAVAAGQEFFAVVDCSGSGYQNAADEIETYMDWYGCEEIDQLILTAVDMTHARNVPQLLEDVAVDSLIIPPEIRKSELSEQIFAIAEQKNIPVTIWQAEGERPVGAEPLGISLIGGVERKLGVRIKAGEQTDLVTLHSFTPKMTDELLQSWSSPCRQLVLSEQHMQEDDCLDAVTAALQPEEILLSSGWYENDIIGDIPMRSTRTEGDFCYQTTMEGRR
ncbi:MAG: ComEC/Rec2 family competence protein [Butyricicoccus sp.]|nr:ComEC/Rec2 family competence protein [Butyricicoccus sp.]